MLDRHYLWRSVKADRDHMLENAPEGFSPRVLVYIVGEHEPIEPDYVATYRDEAMPWVRLQVAGAKGTETLDPKTRLIYAHESTIARIDVVLGRVAGDTRIGFTVAVE